MKMFRKLTGFRSAGSRSTLIAASLAWLGLLLQPCVMAAPVPGAPDSSGTIELSFVMHHGPGMPAEQCVHCVDGTSTRSLLPESCDDTLASSHSPAAKSFDAEGIDWSPAVSVGISPHTLRHIAPSNSPPRTEHLPRTVSLTIAYCVYLE
jgi:hypothetical protein